VKEIDGGVCAAKGFRAAGESCGLKSKAGALDIGMLAADEATASAAVFTTIRLPAAPVLVSGEHLRAGACRAVVVNSGNANACTGDQGLADAREMASLAAAQIGAAPKEVLVASTGIIGHPLPMECIREGVALCGPALAATRDTASRFAESIMTTDTRRKESAVELSSGARIGGTAKGAGMIAPNMATTLTFLSTDADIASGPLTRALRRAVDSSFNCISVDGHMSTNDTVAIIASGQAGPRIESVDDPGYEPFYAGLLRVCLHLAQALVRDGEGATKFVTIEVARAKDDFSARRVAFAIANSPLVKTAIHGGDPNWGRIVSAAAACGEPFEAESTELRIGEAVVFRHGIPVDGTSEKAAGHMSESDILFRIDLGLGHGRATVWTCDLSREYITINADYHT